jgi:D-cysteine desulfhydrase
MLERLHLAHLPTPLWRHDALDEMCRTSVWVKRDDMTAAAAAGNKIRKLEWLVADALSQGATTLLTCGGVQSNHARATALVGAQCGLRVMLFLRTEHPEAPQDYSGNLFLDRLAGAEVFFITPGQYLDRGEVMTSAAAEIRRRGGTPYLIPEGGSNGLGALGYVEAMREVRAQLDLGLGGGPSPFGAIAHACGSGGTAAGVALGARAYDVAGRSLAMAVCDDRATFDPIIARIAREAVEFRPDLQGPGPIEVIDEYRGPAYAVASNEQRDFISEVARRTGLVLDPVYSGKALFGLAQLATKPSRVLFIHTGGLPGLLAQAGAFADPP